MLEARHDAGASFVEYLNSVLLPHLGRMQALRERLFELTGCWIGALADPDDAAVPDFTKSMEEAARTVYERIAALDRAEVRGIQEQRICAGARLLLHHDAFGGTLDTMMPLEAAGETFLRAIEDARQRRQERERLQR